MEKVRIELIDQRYRPVAELLIAGKEGEMIYSARNKVFKINFDGETLCVKSFRCPSFPNSLIYTNLRKSKARRSYENALRLREIGFDTPVPIGYIEIKNNCKLRQSFYICKYEKSDDMRAWSLQEDADTLVEEFARLMVELHRKGVWHKDFSPGNIMFQRTAPGKYRFMLIDLNRMKFDVHDRKRLMLNFRAISLNPNDLKRIAESYAKAADADVDATIELAQRQLRNYNKSKQRHRRLKNLIKKPQK